MEKKYVPPNEEAYEIGTTLVSGDGDHVLLSIVLGDAFIIKLKMGHIEAQKLAQALNVQVAYGDIPRKVKAEVLD